MICCYKADSFVPLNDTVGIWMVCCTRNKTIDTNALSHVIIMIIEAIYLICQKYYKFLPKQVFEISHAVPYNNHICVWSMR